MYYDDYFLLEEPNITWNDEKVEEGDLVEIMPMHEIMERYEKTCRVCDWDYMFLNLQFKKPQCILEEENKIVKTITTDENAIIFTTANIAYYKKMEKTISGKRAIVKKVESDSTMILRFLNDKNNECSQFIYCVPMVKIIEKNYEQNKRVQRELKQVQGNEDLIEEMISKVDVKKVKRILSACFQINAKELKGVDKLLKDWALAKQDIYLLFGKKLRITSENEFEITDEERNLMFLEIQKKFPVEWYIISEFPKTHLIGNHTCDCNMFRYLKGHFPTLKAGMTFSQLLHDVFKNEQLDVEYSKVINTPLVKGYVSISIDPVDYLLMSLNKSGWTSCHTLNDGDGRHFGCYSAGIFSYMCDPCSIITFKHVEKGEEIMYINDTKISALNKAWRQMVYLDISSRAFVASRQYPSENLPASKIVRDMIEKLYVNEFKVADLWKVQYGGSDLSEYISDYYEDEDDRLHYNDIYNDYSGALVYNKLLDNKSVVCAEIGSEPICSICGDEYLTKADRPFCWKCEDKLYNEEEQYDENDDEEEIPIPF